MPGEGEEIARFAARHSLPDAVATDLADLWSKLRSDQSANLILLDIPNRTVNRAVLSSTAEAAVSGRAGGSSGAGLFAGADEMVPLDEQYEALDMIGVGSMGEVRRVRDRALNRTVAMKVIQPKLVNDPSAMHRFIAEARAIAKLEHPGIIPVYDLGRLADGRFFFTMKEVRGRTFADVLRRVYSGPKESRFDGNHGGYSLRQLMHVFYKACEAVGFAHSRGVIHRDLKPENIVVGNYGEVLVVDWGLAKEMFRDETAAGLFDDQIGWSAQTGQTLMGSVLGTPSYMSPEQANGELERHGAPTDVFALGGILYHLLCGTPPYQGEFAIEVICRVQEGPPDPLPEDAAIPQPLREICEQALQYKPEKRFPDAGALAQAVFDWLERSRQREKALEVVDQARQKKRSIGRLTGRAAALREESAALKAMLAPDAPVEMKRPIWALEDEARGLDQGAKVLETMVTQLARAALQSVPELPEAHAFLADYYRECHERAEAERDAPAIAQYQMLLKAHDRGQHDAYLRGDGKVTVVTDPPGAVVEIFRYVEKDRTLVPEKYGRTLETPIENVELPMGSYLFKIRAPGRIVVNYPVQVARHQAWDGIPPGSNQPRPILLPHEADVGPDEVYVPAGWYLAGGDPMAHGAIPRRRVWVDEFVMMRDPVTHRHYLEFLDAMIAQNRLEEALRYVPRGSPNQGPFGRPLYLREKSGRFTLPGEGGLIGDSPVVLVNILCAVMFGYHLSVRTSRRWQLPTETQWEKAARGVDGRSFPWGNAYDPSFCHSGLVGAFPGPIGSHPVDTSVYGIRGLAGNVREWCEPYEFLAHGAPTDTQKVIAYQARGGSCVDGEPEVRTASRQNVSPQARSPYLGFRLVRKLR